MRLRTAGLSVEYRRNQRDAGIWFLNFVAGSGRRLQRRDGPHVVDRWLERGVQAAYEQNIPLYQVTLRVISAQQSFGLSGPLLRNTWSAVRGWRSMVPSRARVPISLYRLECLVLMCLSRGVAEEGLLRRQWIATAIGIWLCFICLLRPGELMNLRREDVSIPKEGWEETRAMGAAVIIRKPKTRRIWREQFVLCKDPRLVKWLKWWLVGLKPGRPIIGLSRYYLNARFSHAISLLGPYWGWTDVTTRWAR